MPAAEQVDVQMVDGLAAVGAGVDDQPIAIAEILSSCDLAGGGNKLAEHGCVLRRGVIERGEMLFGDEQDVHRRLGVNVREGEDVVVLIEAFDGNGAGDDFAEQTIHAGEAPGR